ncbi:MAG: MATE family efflux transporter [Bacteroidales bacterium]|nr:MATE family efflux transporter [Bacteroidales bacterium]
MNSGEVRIVFRKLLIPTLLGSIALSAVTVIDGIFVGHGVGADGVAAINIVAPIYLIMSGLGLMIGSGCSVLAAIHLSKQQDKAARWHTTQAILASSILTLTICLTAFLFPTRTAYLLGSSSTLLPQVLDYLKWILPCFLFEMWSLVGLFVIRLDGSPKYAMWCNIIPSLLNVILDWIFIFPLGMGVKGAAIATAISIIVGGIMAIAYLAGWAKTLRLTPFHPHRSNIKQAIKDLAEQCKIGSSSLFTELTLAILIFVGNLVFMKYFGDAGVGAFGIACYYTPIFVMAGNAIAQSAQPIISYNFGIAQWDKIRQARHLLLRTATATGVVLSLLFIVLPKEAVALFVDPKSLAGNIAIEGFPYFATGILFFILNVAMIGYFQSIKQTYLSNIIVSLRGGILLIPTFLILPHLLGATGAWIAMPITEIITSLIILLICLRSRSR